MRFLVGKIHKYTDQKMYNRLDVFKHVKIPSDIESKETDTEWLLLVGTVVKT